MTSYSNADLAEINLDRLSPGVYVLSILVDGSTTETHKILKK
ncbi:MAG: T9SS type A sorting domain-containing protein [Flavobacterium sp.]|nr:MAG: T9SS type A sorting domain-containing protein [Flavobacterium sp.]